MNETSTSACTDDPTESGRWSRRDSIVDTITRIFWYTDERRWADLIDLFADSVHYDYTGLTGGQPSRLSRAAIASTWRSALEHLDATQHIVGNHVVELDGDAATVTAQFVATHVLGTASNATCWTLGGNYCFQVGRGDGRWTVTAIRMTPVWSNGDAGIMDATEPPDTTLRQGARP
ncbi:MAG: nuclear transport factor 2 family protein [Ilumatobacteraceae bacterium]